MELVSVGLSQVYLVPALMDVVCGRRPHEVSSVCLGPTSSVLAVDPRTRRSCAPAASPGPDAGQSSGRGQAGGRAHGPTRILFVSLCSWKHLSLSEFSFSSYLFLPALASLPEVLKPCTSGRNKMPLRLNLLLNTGHASGTRAFICWLFASSHLKLGGLRGELWMGVSTACKKRETLRPRTGQGVCSSSPALAMCENKF